MFVQCGVAGPQWLRSASVLLVAMIVARTGLGGERGRRAVTQGQGGTERAAWTEIRPGMASSSVRFIRQVSYEALTWILNILNLCSTGTGPWFRCAQAQTQALPRLAFTALESVWLGPSVCGWGPQSVKGRPTQAALAWVRGMGGRMCVHMHIHEGYPQGLMASSSGAPTESSVRAGARTIVILHYCVLNTLPWQVQGVECTFQGFGPNVYMMCM